MGRRPEWLPRREARGGDPARLPVELLDLVVRTYAIVKNLNVNTVGELLETTSAIDVVVAPGSDPMCAENLAVRLAAAGVDQPSIEAWRRAPARRPIPALGEVGEPWGLLFLTGERARAVDVIRAAYSEAGLVPSLDRESLLEPPPREQSTRFGPDHLIHYQAADRVVVVLSQRFELAPLRHNPLALALSTWLGGPVYAFLQSGTEGALGSYERGQLARVFSTTGAMDVPELDLAGLPLSDPERQSLAGLRHNMPALLRLLGIRSYGHQHAQWDHFVDVHAGPEEVPTSSLLAFTLR